MNDASMPDRKAWSDMELAWLAYALLTRQATSLDTLLSILRVRAREEDNRACACLVASPEIRH